MKIKIHFLFFVLMAVGLSVFISSCLAGKAPETLVKISKTTNYISEDGTIFDLIPPQVTNRTNVIDSSSNCVIWSFSLNHLDTIDVNQDGNNIIYKHFEVCTNAGVDRSQGSQHVGWAVLDDFHAYSEDLRTDTTRTFKIQLNSSSRTTVSYYLIDTLGGFHTLGSFDCTSSN